MPKAVPKMEINFRCGECPIRHRAICAYCDEPELERLDDIKSYKAYSAGETIVWAGEEAPLIGSLVSGVATLSRSLKDGRRQMVGLLLPSDFIGRPGRKVAPYDVVAANDVLICQFRVNKFNILIDDTPALERRLLDMTMDELDSAREWMLLLGRKTAREKIASVLVIFARRGAELQHSELGDGLRFEVPLTREAMADYLGLTIETVSRQFSALKKSGVIIMEDARHIRVPDYVRLLNEASDDSDGGVIA
ncbi:MAG: Crp/Fnr family transcriptional regulator [Rhodobacteraceae bacterium]|nr:Crp/Fnr family transcriptional regulator [Paracoccaceae bacterium]